MSSLETTKPINNIISATSTTEKHRNDSLAKRDIDGEDTEMNLFLSDESSGNDQEMDEASGEASGETSNGSNSKKSDSNSSISTTEAWFREFNQNTKELNKNNFDDDGKFYKSRHKIKDIESDKMIKSFCKYKFVNLDSETPYYVNSYKTHPKHPKHPKLVSNQQPSIISRHHQHSQRAGHHARMPSVSNHGNFHNKCEESSGSDSYRSVIDDLTLKNQKLRQKLRKLERIHSKSLHKEKLFEVRYYQMPREKRHELEEYLRQFAAQLSTPDSSSTQMTQNSTNVNDSTENGVISDTLNIKASDKSKMKQVVRAIENVFTTKPPLDDHYLKDQEDADPQGYVYLNLLTNMAQLHTMSVTLPFVKQAIRTFSNCLELNEDGTKVRWRTGLDHVKPDQFSINKNKYAGTSLSGGSSENLSRNGEISSSTGDKQSDSSPSNLLTESTQNYSSDPKNSANAYITPSSLASNTSKPNSQQVKSTPQITHYRPVFLHRNVSSSSSSSGETSSENDQHDGPVIYYEGGLFCTDFSRDVIIDDDDKPTTSSGTQSSPALDNSIADDDNTDIFKEKWNAPRYERATNSILGGNNILLNETSDSGQETDDESSTQLCCGTNDNYSHISVDNPMMAVDDRHEGGSMGINNELNKILMEKDIEFTFDGTNPPGKNYGGVNDWNDDASLSSPSTNNNSKQKCIPDYKRLHTTKVPGVITEDNFMLLVQTIHPQEKRTPHSKESSVDSEVNSSSNSSTNMGQQNNERSQQSSKSHKIISTKLFQLSPSISPQPRTSPPPGVRRTSFATSSKTSSSDSGGSSGYGSSSSSSSSSSNIFSELSSSGTSKDNSYLLKNNTLLQLSQSNNPNLKSSQYDEIQDMELDSLSSDSSDPSPFINIDADEDEEIEIKDDENKNYRKSRIEESVLGMNLRLHDAAIEERRKLADKAAPQEQRFRYLKDIMASSRAMIEALGDNKSNSDVIDGGMDVLPTVPLPFFNQKFDYSERNTQSSSNHVVNNLGNNYNNNL